MVKIAAITITLFLSTHSHACVCSDFEFMPSVAEKHLDQSNYQLFTGKVLSVESASKPMYSDTTGLTDYQKNQSRSFKRVTISVLKSYGDQITMDTIQIATGFGAPDCGVTFFKKGKKYLLSVVAKDEGDLYFWTSICMPNFELKKAEDEIAFIENHE